MSNSASRPQKKWKIFKDYCYFVINAFLNEKIFVIIITYNTTLSKITQVIKGRDVPPGI